MEFNLSGSSKGDFQDLRLLDNRTSNSILNSAKRASLSFVKIFVEVFIISVNNLGNHTNEISLTIYNLSAGGARDQSVTEEGV